MSAARAIVLALLAAACTPAPAAAPDQWTNIRLSATPVELGAQSVGALRFRGGLALDAREAGFGSWSDLDVDDENRLIAISDDGQWLALRLELDAKTGELTGVSNARIARMRDEQGEIFVLKREGDAEDMAQLPDGRLAVSFEQVPLIRIYDMNRDGPFGAAIAGPRLARTNLLPRNAGLEAMAASADGALIVMAEDAGLVWRANLGERAPIEPIARYALQTGFALAGLDRLPNGDFVALERFYAPVAGAEIRITRINGARLAEGELQVAELARLPLSLHLDNFEGVSAVRTPDGDVRLYIMSDDNRGRGRTLLYAFDVVDGGS